MHRFYALALSALCLLQPNLWAQEQDGLSYSVTAIGNASSGDFAPYMIGSWKHGKTAQKGSALLDACVSKAIGKDKEFDWGAGAEFVTGYTTYNDYALYNPVSESWSLRAEGPSAIWLQQLYGEVRYRGIFACAGLKERGSALLNNELSSGDFIESNNARPIPQLRVGFNDFQDIPFTQGWVQIDAVLSYGFMTGDNYLNKHYNYYNYHIHSGGYYSYRRCYFRSNPKQRFSVTAGMQAGSFWGGHTEYYTDGIISRELKFDSSLPTFIKIILPIGNTGEDFYMGSTVGCWDLRMRYRLKNDSELYAYFQGPWEDGSGIGRMNKLDGLWGLEYKSHKRGIINGVVLEYIDFRDQSGPIHWAPADSPNTTITSQATGRDDYYNNGYYNSYANYGLSIGTPFLLSPIYNLDGYPAYVSTRANGVHAGISGDINKDIEYRALFSYQRGLGTYEMPLYRARKCSSLMIEGRWNATALLDGLDMKIQCAIDRGQLRGNNFGMLFSISYSGTLCKLRK